MCVELQNLFVMSLRYAQVLVNFALKIYSSQMVKIVQLLMEVKLIASMVHVKVTQVSVNYYGDLVDKNQINAILKM